MCVSIQGKGGRGLVKHKIPSILVVIEFHPIFPFCLSASTAATYIFTAPTCPATIITLDPCLFNAECQHFISKIQ
jgi:hypothetical protein